MQSTRCRNVRGMRLNSGVVRAEVVRHTIMFYLSVPTLAMLTDTFVARCVRAYARDVAHVLGLGRATKIDPTIIARVFVLMIDLMRRPAPRHERPDYSMRFVESTIDAHKDTPIARATSRYVANFASTRQRDLPRQETGVGIVVEKFTKTFNRQCEHVIYYTFAARHTQGAL